MFKRIAAGLAVLAIGAQATDFNSSSSSTDLIADSSSSSSSSSDDNFTGASDLISDLPGIPDNYAARLFSGALNIDNGGEGFYFFAESQSNTSETDPVILWLNGGPGASSLLGLFTELGPLLINDDGTTLRTNDYAWNLNANLVAIESPIGVGYTYNASGIYSSGDYAQADDLYSMLQVFFGKFPWLRANEFIIMGESYAGVYVPLAAQRIVEGNSAASNESEIINLTKFSVGNAVNEFSTLSAPAFAYHHGLISPEDYFAVADVCPVELRPGEALPTNLTDSCEDALSTFETTISDLNLNNYDIYSDCVSGESSGSIGEMLAELLGETQEVNRPIRMTLAVCISFDEPNSYFNIAEVRDALHANPLVPQWNAVSYTSATFPLALVAGISDEAAATILANKALLYTMDIDEVVTPVWSLLMESGVEGIIYNGDVDMSCDFISGQWAVQSLGLTRAASKTAWTLTDSDQIAGFVDDFGSMKFVTVRGAGHMVPEDKPAEALAMLNQFILN